MKPPPLLPVPIATFTIEVVPGRGRPRSGGVLRERVKVVCLKGSLGEKRIARLKRMYKERTK